MDAAALVTTGADAVADRPPVVRVLGFGKRYGRRTAVAHVDLDVQAGEIYGLIGPDGAGKSTLMKAVAGVLTYDAGVVEVFGTAVVDERSADAVKGRLGFMPQGLGLSLYPELSVDENVDFFSELRGVARDERERRKRDLLAITRLAAFRDRAMKHLSGGMKQKLALVCTLVHEPELVILDEPTTGVDPLSRRDFWAILASLVRDRGLAALVSTSYLDEASRCDRIALLHQGRRLAEGDPEILRRSAPVADAGEPSLEDAYLSLVAREEQADAPSGQVAPAPLPVVAVEDPVVEATSARRSHGEVAIEAEALSRSFHDFRAVDAISFRVGYGEIFGLIGANGAGKTTAIKMLTGILAPTAGSGRVAGMDMRRPGPAVRRRIGYMSQSFSLYADLTARENIALYAGIYGLDRAETRRRTDWIVALGGLDQHLDEMAGRLPMGMRQRLALGCALVHRPQVLFLDEPTSGVDPQGRRRFWQVLFHLARRESVAVLITTHALAEAEPCDHVALTHGGRLLADAPPAELKASVEREVGHVVELVVEPLASAITALRAAGHAEAAPFGRRVHVFAHDPDDEIPRLRAALATAGVRLVGSARRPLTLEDAFVHRVGALEQQEARS